MRVPVPVPFLTALVVASASASAFGQDGLATLRVAIGARGDVRVSGAHVSLAAVSVLTLDRAAEIAVPGVVVFDRLPPGHYTLRVVHPETLPADGVLALGPGEQVEVVATLVRAGATLEIVPGGQGAPPPPARDAPAQAAAAPALSASTIRVVARRGHVGETPLAGVRWRDLPNSGSVWSLVETTEPVTFTDRLDTGGLLAGDPVLVGGHGSSWIQTTFRSDSLDITDLAQAGAPLAYPDLAASDGMTVAGASLPIEAQAPGPLITLVPRLPSRTWHATGRAMLTPNGLVASTSTSGSDPPAIARLDSWHQVAVNAAGPLRERSGVVLGGTWTGASRTERRDPTILRSSVGSAFGRLVLLPTSRDELQLMAAGQRVGRPFPGRARLLDTTASETDRLLQVHATWAHVSRVGGSWSVSGGVEHGTFSPAATRVSEPCTIDRLEDGPVPNLASWTAGTRAIQTLAVRRSFGLWTTGTITHRWRAGATLSHASAESRPFADGPIAELVDGLPARAWDYRYVGPASRRHERVITVYAADSMAVGTHLTIDAGIRLDRTRGDAEDALQDIAWLSASPRVSARWSLRDDALSVIAGVGRYQYRLPLEYLAFGDPHGLSGTVSRWVDGDGDGILQANERGALVARVGPGSPDGRASIDAGLEQPRTDEVVAALEWRLPGAWRASLVGVARRDRHLVASVNVGVPASAYTVRIIQDPGADQFGPAQFPLPIFDRLPASFGMDQYLLTNPAGLHARYEGLDLTIERQWARGQLLFGGTASRTGGPAGNRGFGALENDQGMIGELLENPNAATHATGRLFFDRAFTAKLSGTAIAPHDVFIGAAARYQDGQNFARYVIVPDLAQGPEAIRAFPNGGARFTYTFTLDVRIEKALTLRRWRLGGIVEVFNLLNTSNEVEEQVAGGPGFRRTTAVQPPRAARLGIRVDF